MTRTIVDVEAQISKILEGPQRDVLLEIMAGALAQVMEAEVSDLCRAGLGERRVDRVTHRNGYRERPLETRLGSLQLLVPKVRTGSYFPSFLDPRRRWEKAFVNVVSEAYLMGVSTRKVESLIEAMGAKGMSKSEVSRLAESLDRQVEAFRLRPLSRDYPYVWLDALYLKVREGGRVVSKALMVATAVSDQGEREVIGATVTDGEMESAWREFLEHLVQRGLRGVMLVISDAHLGLKGAVRKVLVGATWQRCTVHFLRNVLSRVPRNAQGVVGGAIKSIFKQPSMKEAKEAVGKALATLQKRFPGAASLLREAEEDVLAFMAFPEKHWRQIHSTNPLERLNREIRRRTDVVGIFPTVLSVLRLTVMLLAEQQDEWTVGRRYFSLESMAILKTQTEKTLEAA